MKNKYVTENKVFQIVNDAAEKILEGVQTMFDDQNARNDKKFATKDDLKREIGAVREEMATKDDLKREIGFVRNDINGLKADLSTVPTRKEFESLKKKVDRLTN